MWTQEWSDIPSRSELHLGHVPPGAHLGVGVEPLEQRLEPAVAAGRARRSAPPLSPRRASARARRGRLPRRLPPASRPPLPSRHPRTPAESPGLADADAFFRLTAGLGCGVVRVGEGGEARAVPTPALQCLSAAAGAVSRRCWREFSPELLAGEIRITRTGPPKRPDRRRAAGSRLSRARPRAGRGIASAAMSDSGQLELDRRDQVARRHPAAARRSATRSRSSCASSSPRRSPPSRPTTTSAASCSPAPAAPSARGWTRAQFGGDRAHRERLVETSTLAFEAVGDCPRPVVAAVNGPALAGGFALALLCDLRIAGRAATFGYPELPRGIPPSYAAARAVLPATVAQELCLTGRIVEAPEAQRLGIVREVASRRRARAGGRARRADRGAARARRSSRPSAARCSSATTCGAFCSTRRSASSAAPCSARPKPPRPDGDAAQTAGVPQAYGETAARMWGQT